MWPTTNMTSERRPDTMEDNLAFQSDKPGRSSLGEPALTLDTSKDTGPAATRDGKASKGPTDLLYYVEDVPAWYMCCFLSLQHTLTMLGSTITTPFIFTPLMCIADTDPARGKIICTMFFVSGLVTLLQTTIGVRLPIVQGGTFSLLVPIMTILTTSFPACQSLPLANMTAPEREEEWQVRMREVQGAIAVSAIFQFVIGFTGLVGLLLDRITPLAIVPTITLIGLSIFDVAAVKASQHWGISSMTMALMILFSQFLQNVRLPFPGFKRSSGPYVVWVHVFKLFPVLLAILLSWGLCWVLTVAGALEDGSKARTDLTRGLLNDSPWFRIPYPGQWGLPTVSVAGVVGMLTGVMASIIESIGDYYACARISGVAPPPIHAVNRGIGIEGFGGILAGLWGSGNGTTSYSENIGAIGITKVGSRRVVQVGAVMMLLFGMVGKFGAVFATIPEPVVGGVFCVMFAMITAVGLSTLQFVDLNSSRNLFVLGFSIFFGIALPKWMASNPGVIDTGAPLLDQLLRVLLETSMFVGGFLGILLDNTVPGTREERGLVKWNAHLTTPGQALEESRCYDFPYGMDIVRQTSWMRYLPFSPTFRGFLKIQVQ